MLVCKGQAVLLSVMRNQGVVAMWISASCHEERATALCRQSLCAASALRKKPIALTITNVPLLTPMHACMLALIPLMAQGTHGCQKVVVLCIYLLVFVLCATVQGPWTLGRHARVLSVLSKAVFPEYLPHVTWTSLPPLWNHMTLQSLSSIATLLCKLCHGLRH